MNLRTGRLAARHPVGLRWVHDYFLTPLPTAPQWVSYPGGRDGADDIDWGMLGNDQYGDCTLAGMAHMFMANAATYGQTIPSFVTDEIVHVYLNLTGGQDSGLVEADVLKYAMQTGLWGNRIAGYAPGKVHDFNVLKVIISEFRASYLGITIPKIALTQFLDGQPWDLTGGPADRQMDGGHCVTAVGYNPEYVYVITWGKVQKVTWRWLGAYMEEMWAVLTPEDAKVDLITLQKDLNIIPTYR